MKAVKVQYTVSESYAKRNAENITQVMADLRKLNNPHIKYSSFLLDDKKSFVHFVITDKEENDILTGLESFKRFQSELKASQPEIPPKVEHLNLVGSSYDFFSSI
jgi:gamma-glutamyltranspeptidase